MTNIAVTFRHVDPSQALKDYVTEKLGKVQKILDRPFEANVTLSVEKYRHIAEVFLVSQGITIKAFESTEDLYSAIDLVCDKVERQMKKYRDKKKEKGAGSVPVALVSGSSLLVTEDEGRPVIVRHDYFIPKPMSVEDAAKYLDILKTDVMMFINQETNRPSVVFRQQDGNIGFTEPAAR